jgi:threonine/homoserine/homoserine lactone efflux protein
MLTAFWVVSISLVVVPGADWAYAISAGMRHKAIAPAIAGMLLGYLAITLVVAGGVGALVTQVPGILAVLTYVGAAYLLWLGGITLARPAIPGAGHFQAQSTRIRWVVQGFVVSGVNPKALLLFLALLPQFTSMDGSLSLAAQIEELGFIHILNCAVVYSLVAVASRAVLRSRPSVARAVSRVSGGAMIAVGLLLIAERFLSV